MGKGWPDFLSELITSWDKNPAKTTRFVILVFVVLIAGFVVYEHYTKSTPTQSITAPGDNNVNANTNNGTIRSSK